MKSIYSKEFLEPIVKESFSYAEVLKKIGRAPIGGNYKTIKQYIQDYKLDISHFTGQRWNTGKSNGDDTCLNKLQDVLQKDTNYRSSKLLDRLVKQGLKEYKCEVCGISNWNNEWIRLELHHKDCDHFNNELSNLQVLCPNCHSQTPGHKGRGTKRNFIPTPKRHQLENKICEVCGKEFKPQRKTNRFCSRECYNNYLTNPNKLNNINNLIIDKITVKIAMNKANNLTELSAALGISNYLAKNYLEKYNLTETFKDKIDFYTKPVLQYDKKHNLIREWPSGLDAENALGIFDISKVCRFRRHSAGGYIWRYKS